MGAIAPEKLKLLTDSIKDLTMELTEDFFWVCNYSPSDKTIRFSQRAGEFMWCACYAYYITYKELVENQKYNSQNEIHLNDIPAVKKALELYRWALDDIIYKRCSEWPSGCPVPTEPVYITEENFSPILVVGEFTLCAIAFVLHHELAHHIGKHNPANYNTNANTILDSLTQEKEADNSAVDWVMTYEESIGEKAFEKRALGLAIAYNILVGEEMVRRTYKKNIPPTTHPPAWTRLRNVMERTVKDETSIAWSMCIACLRLHMEYTKISFHQKQSYENAKEAVNALIDCIDGHFQNLSP